MASGFASAMAGNMMPYEAKYLRVASNTPDGDTVDIHLKFWIYFPGGQPKIYLEVRRVLSVLFPNRKDLGVSRIIKESGSTWFAIWDQANVPFPRLVESMRQTRALGMTPTEYTRDEHQISLTACMVMLSHMQTARHTTEIGLG